MKDFLPLAASLLLAFSATAGTPPPAPVDNLVQRGSDIPAKWVAPDVGSDYVKQDVMIPMRDGVKLHTMIVMPKDGHDMPIVLDRTPYDAGGFMNREDSPHGRDNLRAFQSLWFNDGYVVVMQDIRGKHGSQGDYVMTRPPIGPLNPSKTDDATDAYDTIDWLLKNVKGNNGRVGMIGTSYDGWAVTMALLAPHPALKVAAPQSPMIDGWMGDDWFHYGAFRQVNLDYIISQTSHAGKGETPQREGPDDYLGFLQAGSANDWASKFGIGQIGFWQRVTAHPAYDAFWQGQALDRALVARATAVPTMWLQGLWDQEDIYGAVTAWEALKGKGANNHLVLGPWFHGQYNRTAEALGPLKWMADTGADFRRNVLLPFFNTYLKDQKPAHALPPVLVYNAAEKHWDSFADWPGTTSLTPLYLQAGSGLAFAAAAAGEDSYISDPAKPVPFLPPPVSFNDTARWATWLVQDQRLPGTRTDVLSYQTPVLTTPVIVQGAPVADIFATTTGTDGDFVVKVIDVYPPNVPEQAEMSGYQLAISQDIFRGRYRHSFEHPSPITAGQVEEYRFRLPTVNYVFKPGHRIMVQIQSSLFPLYDRNPQTYVPNIFFAKPADYQKATIAVQRGAQGASAVLLPVVPSSTALK